MQFLMHAPFSPQVDAAKKQASADAALRRLCTPKPNSGRLEVSQQIYQQWKAGGTQRKCLLDVFVKAGFDKDPLTKTHWFKGWLPKHNDSNHDLLTDNEYRHLWTVLPWCDFSPSRWVIPERRCSKSRSSTCRRSPEKILCMSRRGSTPKRPWNLSLVGNRHLLSADAHFSNVTHLYRCKVTISMPSKAEIFMPS